MELNMKLKVEGPVESAFSIPASDTDDLKKLQVFLQVRAEILSTLEYEFGSRGVNFYLELEEGR